MEALKLKQDPLYRQPQRPLGDMVQWILQGIMETEPDLARSCLDDSNAFGDLERSCIKATLQANVALHPLIPLFDVLYTRGQGALWYYDEMKIFILAVFCRKGVRQGFVLDTTILCVTVRPAYDAFLVILGPEGFFSATPIMSTWVGYRQMLLKLFLLR